VTLARAQGGVVYVEFLFSFIPVFVLFLGIVQLALLSAARLVVQHAAVAGVRAAVVVLDDEPRFYEGTSRGDIADRKQARNDGYEQALAGRLGIADETATSTAPAIGGPRMAAIRRAVHAPLTAIVPEPSLFAQLLLPFASTSLSEVLGSTPVTRLLFGLTLYLPGTTAVTFPVAPNAPELVESSVPKHGSVTVRVTHIVPCLVPVVSALICERLGWDPLHRTLWGRQSEPRALHELSLAPNAGLQVVFALSAAPVVVLQAEATMPAQAAEYPYASEPKKEAH
jgi:hypothetical protein